MPAVHPHFIRKSITLPRTLGRFRPNDRDSPQTAVLQNVPGITEVFLARKMVGGSDPVTGVYHICLPRCPPKSVNCFTPHLTFNPIIQRVIKFCISYSEVPLKLSLLVCVLY